MAHLLLDEFFINIIEQNNVRNINAYDAINHFSLNSLHKNLYAHGNAANNTLIQVASSIGTSIIITLMSKVSTSSIYTYTAKTQVHGINVLFFAKKGLYTNYLVQQPHLQLLTTNY